MRKTALYVGAFGIEVTISVFFLNGPECQHIAFNPMYVMPYAYIIYRQIRKQKLAALNS